MWAHQSKYALELMKKFNMKDFKPIKAPFLSIFNLEKAHSTPFVNNILYKKLGCCLLYSTHTRPDISYAVSVASRYMDQPHEIHWRAAKRILIFVQGTKTHGIHYVAQLSIGLVGFTESDWEGDKADRNQLLNMCLCLQMDQSVVRII